MRSKVSRRLLRGRGIEIGALHSPVEVSQGTHVTYVDRLTTTELVDAYSEQGDFSFVDVDLVDDGERLHEFDDRSLDFIVANHMLEHCENPLGTIRTPLSKLKVGGILYYIVPDRQNSFDSNRPITPFDHLERNNRKGPESSRESHYLEYAKLVEGLSGAEAITIANRMLTDRVNIHFGFYPVFTDG